jgi:hypothetical protein
MKKFKRVITDYDMSYNIVEKDGVVVIYLYDDMGEEYDKIYGNDVETLCEILIKRLEKNVRKHK